MIIITTIIAMPLPVGFFESIIAKHVAAQNVKTITAIITTNNKQ